MSHVSGGVAAVGNAPPCALPFVPAPEPVGTVAGVDAVNRPAASWRIVRFRWMTQWPRTLYVVLPAEADGRLTGGIGQSTTPRAGGSTPHGRFPTQSRATG